MSDAPRGTGDMDPESFRREGHRVVDWIADYYAHPERYPVLSQVKPGDIRRSLPAEPPEQAEAFASILADFEKLIVPGITHWNHPGFFAYFAITGSGPGRAGGAAVRRAQRPGHAVADLAVGDRARGGVARVAASADGPARHLRRRHLRHGVDLEPARAGDGARGVDRPREDRGDDGPARAAALPRLLLRPGALVDRQGGDPARPRPRQPLPRGVGRRFPHAARRARAGHRRGPRGRHRADGRGRHGGDDLHHQRGPGTRDRGDLRARTGVAPRGLRLRRLGGHRARVPPHPRRRGAGRLDGGEPAQVAVHAVRPQRVLLPADGPAPPGVLAHARVPANDGSRRR